MFGKENKSWGVLFSYLPVTSVLLTMAARMKYGVANEKEIRWTSLLCSIVEFVERGPFDSACRSKVFYHEMFS